MAINDVNNTSQVLDQYSKPSNAGKPKDNELGRDAFLSLMVAQLNNQDPLEATDNQAFVAQLAQFSTVAGIEKHNTSMVSMQSRFSSTCTSQATSMVGQSDR